MMMVMTMTQVFSRCIATEALRAYETKNVHRSLPFPPSTTSFLLAFKLLGLVDSDDTTLVCGKLFAVEPRNEVEIPAVGRSRETDAIGDGGGKIGVQSFGTDSGS